MTTEVYQSNMHSLEVAESGIHANKKLCGKSLMDAIRRQVEFYFSKQNLANDSYLISKMSHQMYVPIDVIVTFSKMKELTEDTALIAEAIRGSNVCFLNDEANAIKPNIKSERNTIILREIPTGTKEEDVKSIFDDCGKVANIRSDVGDTWFVTMATEEDAVDTLLKLRSKKFNDAPIKARLKSENIMKSFFSSVSEKSTVNASGNYSHVPSGGYFATPVVGYLNGSHNYGIHPVNGQVQPRMYQGTQGYEPDVQRYQSKGQQRSAIRGGSKHPNGVTLKDGNRKTSHAADRSKKNTDKKNLKEKRNHPTERQPILTAANFPPLPACCEKKDDPSEVVMTPTSIYQYDDIMEIIKNMSDSELCLADGKMDFEKHAIAVKAEANVDLLKSQRTYSIEQAREAMRQGRPIRSDSIGSVDYESMMYGEEYTKEVREARKSKKPTQEKSDCPTESPKSCETSVDLMKGFVEPQQEPQPKKTGYAAALLNGTPVSAPQKINKLTPEEKNDDQLKKSLNFKGAKNVNTSKIGKNDNTTASSGKEPIWGGKRTFVDVLKTKSESEGADVKEE